MKAYYGSRFSPNMTSTPEGFLVAHNVPIARAGWYDYEPQEIGAPGNGPVKVYRDPSQVFSPAAMASFEGKPVTDNHPPNGVSPTDARLYVKGATQNVRQGSGDDADLLLADLVIFDASLIREIQNGKREVSAGYECDYEPNSNGTYSQHDIVGNHVAVVDKGRAGDRVKINDRRTSDMDNVEAAEKYGISEKKDGHRTPPEGYPADREQYADPVNYKYPLNGAHARDAIDYFNRPAERGKGDYTPAEWDKIGHRIVDACNKQDGGGYEIKDGHIVTPDDRRRKGNDRMPSNKNRPPLKAHGPVTNWLAAVGLKHWAQDAEPDELADTVDAMVEERTGDESAEEAKANEKAGMENKDADPNDAKFAALSAKIDEIMDMVKGMKDKTGDEKTAEEQLDAAIAQAENPSGNQEESHTIDPALIGDDAGVVLPESERPKSALNTVDRASHVVALKAIRSSLAAIPDPAVRKKVADAALATLKTSTTTYAAIDQATRQRATADAQKAAPVNMEDLGRQWAEQRNPHYKKNA